MENSAHFGALDGQLVVFGHGLLSLKDPDLDAFLLHEVQSGRRNLRDDGREKVSPVRFSAPSGPDPLCSSVQNIKPGSAHHEGESEPKVFVPQQHAAPPCSTGWSPRGLNHTKFSLNSRGRLEVLLFSLAC